MSNEVLIKELRALINPVIKGSTGYASLANSERVTAHKILLIVSKLNEDKQQWVKI